MGALPNCCKELPSHANIHSVTIRNTSFTNLLNCHVHNIRVYFSKISFNSLFPLSLYLGVPNGIIPSGFATKTLHVLLSNVT